MTKQVLLVTVALLSFLDCAARAGEDEPNSEEIRKFAVDYMKQLTQQKMSEREIANQLNISESNCRTLLHRAKKKLKECIKMLIHQSSKVS